MKKYCRLLFEMAQKKKMGLYIINFGKGNKNQVKERIEMMLNGKNRKKRWQIFSGAVLSLMILMVSSITTFAYEPPAVIGLKQSGKEVEHGHSGVDRVFVSDGYESTEGFFDAGVVEMSFEDSDAYFVDEQGNRYDVAENTARIFCNHTFTSGKYQEHVKKGAGCTVSIYNANRCTKCDYVELVDLYSEHNYTICPH